MGASLVRQALLEKDVWDRTSSIAAASYLYAINLLVVNTLPLILGALADTYGLKDSELGQISAVYVGAITLSTLTAPAWIRLVNWRTCTFVAVAASTLVLALGSSISGLIPIVALFAVLGCLKGVLGAPAFASLGDSTSPDRAYGVSVAYQGLLAAVLAGLLSTVVLPRFGIAGAFVGLAAMVGSGFVACLWLPSRGRSPIAKSTGPGSRPQDFFSIVPALLAFAALFLFLMGILGFWYFVERIGVASGVPAPVIGLTISLSALGSVFTAAIVGWLGGRVRSLAFIATGTLLVLAGFLALQIRGDWPFISAVALFSFGWGLGQPAYWAILRRVDATNRLFVIAPAATGAAGVTIGLLAGTVIEAGGYQLLVFVCGASMSVAALCAALASRLAGGLSLLPDKTI